MLTEKEKRTLQLCEKRLALPPVKFVLLYGILAWGIPVGIIVSLLDVIEGNKTFAQIVKGQLWFTIGSFIIGGILFGLVMRWFLQNQYRRLKAKDG